MRIRSNPRRNIRLFELKDFQSGFISSDGVKGIKKYKGFNMAINLNSLVYTSKSDDSFLPVFGTGDLNVDFEIDLSSFVVDESKLVDYKTLKEDKKAHWYPIRVDILDNVLSYDYSDFDDESIEGYFDDWLSSSHFEKKDLLQKIKDFLLRDFDSMDVVEIVDERKNLIGDIRFLEESTNSINLSFDYDQDDLEDDFQDHFNPVFHSYSDSEKRKILDLLLIKLDFINNYLLSSDNWQSLSKGTFLSIKEYMIEKERYEILEIPTRYFAKKNN